MEIACPTREKTSNTTGEKHCHLRVQQPRLIWRDLRQIGCCGPKEESEIIGDVRTKKSRISAGSVREGGWKKMTLEGDRKQFLRERGDLL